VIIYILISYIICGHVYCLKDFSETKKRDVKEMSIDARIFAFVIIVCAWPVLLYFDLKERVR
jgi:hypothetical protein